MSASAASSPVLSTSAPSPVRSFDAAPSVLCAFASLHEPSWCREADVVGLVAHVLRPRLLWQEPSLRTADSALLVRHCLAMGRDANAAGKHALAHAFFESAYNVRSSDVGSLLSAINMRLRLGQYTLAAALYARLIDEDRCKTDAHRELVRRKLAEAQDAALLRARATRPPLPMEDEVVQLVQPLEAHVEAPTEERVSTSASPTAPSPPAAGSPTQPPLLAAALARLLRRLGHLSNERGDVDAAQNFFSSAFVVARHPADLLSAANMRLKLEDTSAAAEAMYDYLLSLPAVDETAQRLAVAKLEAIQARRLERACERAAGNGMLTVEQVVLSAAQAHAASWAASRAPSVRQ